MLGRAPSNPVLKIERKLLVAILKIVKDYKELISNKRSDLLDSLTDILIDQTDKSFEDLKQLILEFSRKMAFERESDINYLVNHKDELLTQYFPFVEAVIFDTFAPLTLHLEEMRLLDQNLDRLSSSFISALYDAGQKGEHSWFGLLSTTSKGIEFRIDLLDEARQTLNRSMKILMQVDFSQELTAEAKRLLSAETERLLGAMGEKIQRADTSHAHVLSYCNLL